MAKEKAEKNTYATKQATGSLYRAAILTTDPAFKLSFYSSLISIARGALIQKLEDRVPDSEMIPGIFNSTLKWILRGAPHDENTVRTIDERIDQIFKSESMERYGLEIFRDAIITESLLNEWKNANKTYITAPAAWVISNSMLADISLKLDEIIIRHDLMQFPKGELFNLDDSDTTAGAISRIVNTMREGKE